MTEQSSLDLSSFYPKECEIKQIIESDKDICIYLKSRTQKQTCPKCHQESVVYHSTYRRRLQDLPVLGKGVKIHLTAYRYYCHSKDCDQKVFSETINGFCGNYKRMTGRLEDFLIALAIQTSCEGASRISSHLGIKVSGDTIIRILLARVESIETVKTDMVGIDDWAYRKGATYGTIIVDGRTHKAIDLLDGRDGSTLKEWLKQNKQVKIVTRDRASAYAAAIQEVLPDALQIADRFHLHQNLMEAIKKVLAQELPDKIRISNGVDSGKALANNTASQNNFAKKNRQNRVNT